MRKWIMALALLAMSALSAPTHAQTVFLDDFDGDTLLPHWNQPLPSSWDYNVSNSMLNVTGLNWPSSVWMNALFAPQSDFRMDVWMGWEAGDAPHRLRMHVGGPFQGSPLIATMAYSNEGAGPMIYAQTTGPSVTMAAPAPGIHHFTISRTGTQFNFFFNGSPFASFADNFGTPAAAINLEFLGPNPGTFGAFQIDRVLVVPAPSALIAFSWALVCPHKRRRHR